MKQNYLTIVRIANQPYGIRPSWIVGVQNVSADKSRLKLKQRVGKLKTSKGNIPLYDLSSLEERSDGQTEQKKRALIIKMNTSIFSLIVDTIEGKIMIQNNSIYKLPSLFKGVALNCFPKICLWRGELILIIQPRKLRQEMEKSKNELAESLG